MARFLASLAASVATSVARRRAKTLASFALSGSTLRTIRASRWHQHEIETPSKTGKCFGATDLRCKMPDVAEVVNRGLRRYDSAHDAHPPGLGTSRRGGRSVWSGRTRNPRVPRKPEPGHAEVANSDGCEARSRIDGYTHRAARTSSRSRRSCPDQVRRRFPPQRRNNTPQLRQRKRLAPREFPILRLPERSCGDTPRRIAFQPSE